MKPQLKGSLFILLSLLIFSCDVFFLRKMNLSPLSFFAATEIISIFLLVPFIWFSKNLSFKPKHSLKTVFLFSVVTVLAVFTYYTAILSTTLGNAILTSYTHPLFVVLLAPLLLKEKVEWQNIAAVVLGSLGIVFLFQASLSKAHTFGILLGTLSGLFFALQVIIAKKLLTKGNVINFIFYRLLFILILIFPALFFVTFTLKIFLQFLVLSLLLLFALYFYFSGIQQISAQHASIISYTQILMIVALGIIAFQEYPSGKFWLSSVLIILAGVWAIRREIAPKNQPKPI